MDDDTKRFNELVAVFDACADNDRASIETVARWYERNGQAEHAEFLRQYAKKHNL